MSNLRYFPLTREQFGKFIINSNGKKKFLRMDSETCPLTRALQQLRPKAKNDFGNGPATLANYDLPRWAKDFIDLFDFGGVSAYQAAITVGAIKRKM